MKAKTKRMGVIRREINKHITKPTTTNNSLPTVKRHHKKALTTSQNISTARKTSAAPSAAAGLRQGTESAQQDTPK